MVAYIRTTRKLPSGVDGWYIYLSTCGKLFISSPDWDRGHHTIEDTKVIRDILNQAIEDMEEDLTLPKVSENR